MMFYYHFILVFLCLTSGLNAQQSSSTDIERQSDSSIENKPENLPNVTWTILDMDTSSRENLCQRQIAYCLNNCGGTNAAPKNFCNSSTMAWNCGCALKVPDLTPYLWPVVQAECIGKAQDCLSICNKKPAASAGPCSHACQTYYQCNTEMAPPSYLRTDSPDETPASYNGPPTPKQSINNNSTTDSNSTTAGNNSTSSHGSNQQSSLASTIFNATFKEAIMFALLFIAVSVIV